MHEFEITMILTSYDHDDKKKNHIHEDQTMSQQVVLFLYSLMQQ